MSEVVENPTNAQRDHAHNYWDHWGPTNWLDFYQSDDRCRVLVEAGDRRHLLTLNSPEAAERAIREVLDAYDLGDAYVPLGGP